MMMIIEVYKILQNYALGLSAITERRLCKIVATNKKIEHIPNITVMGNAATLKWTLTKSSHQRTTSITVHLISLVYLKEHM